MSLKQMQQYCIVIGGLVVSQYLLASEQSEFDGWMQSEVAQYSRYRDKQDKAFTEFLRLQWKEMKVYQGLERDKAPKPVNIPVAKKPGPDLDNKPEKSAPQEVVVSRIQAPVSRPVEITPSVDKVIVPPSPALPAERKKIANQKSLSIKFFGQVLDFDYDGQSRQPINGRIDKDVISDYWSSLSKTDYQPLLQQLKDTYLQLDLNDWSYVYLVNILADKIYDTQPNEKILFSWFVLSKLGYQVRAGYDEQRVYLLAASTQVIYASKYFNFEGNRYYALQLDNNAVRPGNIFTYSGHYPTATKPLDMRLTRPLKTVPEFQSRQLAFSFKNSKHTMVIEYDAHTVAFMNTYPQLDIALYFETPVYSRTSEAMLSQLKRVVDGLSEEDAVNLLLRFVQTAFSYKTDQQQFGSENYLFIEETISYPYSDCEDRSILFAWLVRQLLGLEVVGLDYPGHIATAVQLKTVLKGDVIIFNNKQYTVADPTYINASLGMSMPAFKASKPKVIHIGR